MNENNENKSYYSSLSGVKKAVPILLAAVAVFIGACLMGGSGGAIGQPVSAVLLGLFSFGAYLIPLILLIHAVCYAEDVAHKKLKSRAVFSLVAIMSASAIEYSVRFWQSELVFAPTEFYANGTNGGFIGSVIGFAVGKLIGNVGIIILAAAILAIFATFFYADKTGSFGKRALAFKAGVSNTCSGIKAKLKEASDKNKKLKAEEAQYKREQISDELADDDFFKSKDGTDVKVAKLGIDESASPTGAATLLPQEEEEVVFEEPVEEQPKRAHKPLDLNYGIEDTDITYRTSGEAPIESAPESSESKTYDSKFFGLDDSAENVFTKNFEPFNFATSEKLATKPSSKTIVQEEIDEWTMMEMKGEPTEREKRMMELERKKKEWLKKKELEKSASASVEKAADEPAPTVSAPASVPVSEVKESVPAPAPTPVPVAPAPAPAPSASVESAPAAVNEPIPSEVNTYTSYSTTKTTYTAPIKTVEFTITNDPKPSYSEPVERALPNTAQVNHHGESAEEVADIIAQKIAQRNPAYARSANEMKTYTKVISSGDDELYQPKSESAFKAPSDEFTIEFAEENSRASESVQTSYEFDDKNETHASTAPESAQSSYARAAGFAEALAATQAQSAAPEFKPYETPVAAEAQSPAPEFKPYEAPAVSAPTPAIADDNATIKVEREILSPTPTSPTVEAIPEPEEAIPEADPVELAEVEPEAADTDFEWTSDEAPDEAVAFEEDDSEEMDLPAIEEIQEDAPSEEEIPPEEQNPDVIKMREMFPFLAPLDEQKPPENKPMPEEEEAEDDLPPFDEPVIAKSAPVKENLAPVPAKAEPKKPDFSDYVFPSIELLAKEEAIADENIQSEIQENADKLIETLASFNVTASIKGVDRGPRITRYEVVPAKGVKVSSILNLQDDIALNLAAGSIRMEAPIPGKSAVGIEIPNKKSSTVRLRDLLETEEFRSNKSKTAVCIGRDVAGQPVFGDIAKMPHLLIAGATGMGKSVCINSLLISVLYKARPDEVKLIMIDPKQVEFTMYNGIPHLLVPVVSDAKQAAGALMWAVEEMERRYNLLNPLCVRNIDAYNEKVAQDRSLGEPMSRIIIVIDEFADLMLQVKDPVETLVMRIAQKARAAGIYLVIGTQRPSVNVITGVIKANVPSRISCKVMSNVDSKTVLDSAGAEKLLDRGDMLYAPAGSPKPHRVQGAFVADGEVEAIMQHLKQFSDGSNYDSTVMEEIERAAQKCSKKGGGSSDYDDGDSEVHGEGYLNDRQFLDAVEVAVNTRKISTSLIQRKLSIGYGKAAKFIDIMEDMGIVGEANGQRPREVLITPDEWREKLARATLD